MKLLLEKTSTPQDDCRKRLMSVNKSILTATLSSPLIPEQEKKNCLYTVCAVKICSACRALCHILEAILLFEMALHVSTIMGTNPNILVQLHHSRNMCHNP